MGLLFGMWFAKQVDRECEADVKYLRSSIDELLKLCTKLTNELNKVRKGIESGEYTPDNLPPEQTYSVTIKY